MPLIRPWTDAGCARTRCSRSVGRTKPCNGPTTVGPEAARITPIITAGWSAKANLVLRQAFGGTLLLGLEILVAADLIRTIAVAPTLNNVFQLGLIVVIRTFLSFSLETEIEGVPPWRRALIGGAGTIRRASASALESETPPRQP